MTLNDSIEIINKLLTDHLPWLETKAMASLAKIDDSLGYVIEKEYKDRDNVMPSDVLNPISYFTFKRGSAIPIKGSEQRFIQNGQRINFKVRQIFIINIDNVEDADLPLFTDKVSMCREKILDVYINKQVTTGFNIDGYVEDLENVFDGMDVKKYESMRYPYIYIALDLSVVATAICI